MSHSLQSSPSGSKSVTMPPCEAATEWLPVPCDGLPANAEVGRFRGANGLIECHITVRLTGESSNPHADLANAYQRALEVAGTDASTAVFRRFFCSDVLNQAATLDKAALDSLFGAAGPCADSILGQPPLPAAKLALWAYHLHTAEGGVEVTGDANTVSWKRGGLTHHWTTGCIEPAARGSHEQTLKVLQDYDAWLGSKNMSMADHVVRTWWYVQNVDAGYQGLVDARCGFFDTHGLTHETHYIASTGIQGAPPDVAAEVSMDAYAIGGLRGDQVDFIGAPDHLCPTHDYGVTFERATSVAYADRRHVFISGTASIDTKGEILHVGDVASQLDRTLENIEALLAQVDSHLGDLNVALVYLRDAADGTRIQELLSKRLGNIPYVLVDAPVCRPGWLIEIEGVATVPAHLPELPDF